MDSFGPSKFSIGTFGALKQHGQKADKIDIGVPSPTRLWEGPQFLSMRNCYEDVAGKDNIKAATLSEKVAQFVVDNGIENSQKESEKSKESK